MFIVETVCKPRFISGIFTDKEKAKECFSEPGPILKVFRQANVQFPFYVVEEHGNRFRYVHQTQVLKILRNIDLIPDEEHTYLNIYYICQEFKAKKVGADEMWVLSHYHVNNAWLRRFDQCGEVLIAEMS